MNRQRPDYAELVSISRMGKLLWENRWVVSCITGIFVAAALLYGLMLPHQYRATVTILPQQQNNNFGILGQIANFSGIGMGSSGYYEDLYTKILVSDRILSHVLENKWNYCKYDTPVSIFEIFNVSYPDSGAQQRSKAKNKIKSLLRRRVVSFTRDKITGFMTLGVKVPNDPAFAADLANFMIEALDDYNREFRIGKASEQRVFIEDRLKKVEQELEDFESSLTRFVQAKRRYQSSPPLLQKFNEIQRNVTAHTSIWVELRRQLELAKIEENQETVSITILDRAMKPTEPSDTPTLVFVLLGLVTGLIASGVFILIWKRPNLKVRHRIEQS